MDFKNKKKKKERKKSIVYSMLGPKIFYPFFIYAGWAQISLKSQVGPRFTMSNSNIRVNY